MLVRQLAERSPRQPSERDRQEEASVHEIAADHIKGPKARALDSARQAEPEPAAGGAPEGRLAVPGGNPREASIDASVI